MITHRYLQSSLKHKCLTLKITKRLSKVTMGKKSEAVNTRRSDNALAKRKKIKRTNNNLQNTTHKTEELLTGTPLKTGVNSYSPDG